MKKSLLQHNLSRIERKYAYIEALLRQFLRNPNWVRMLHDEDCLPTYDEDDPSTCRCDGIIFEVAARDLFPELETKLFLS